MPRSSSEKKGHSSLTRVHIVRRNSNALFRNSATECNTFEMIFSETIFKETTSGQPDFSKNSVKISVRQFSTKTTSCFDLLEPIFVSDQQCFLWHSCLHLQYPTYFSNVFLFKCCLMLFNAFECSTHFLLCFFDHQFFK